jgi:hypothetical protein
LKGSSFIDSTLGSDGGTSRGSSRRNIDLSARREDLFQVASGLNLDTQTPLNEKEQLVSTESPLKSRESGVPLEEPGKVSDHGKKTLNRGVGTALGSGATASYSKHHNVQADLEPLDKDRRTDYLPRTPSTGTSQSQASKLAELSAKASDNTSVSPLSSQRKTYAQALETKWIKHASGVFYHCSDRYGSSSLTCYQLKQLTTP